MHIYTHPLAEDVVVEHRLFENVAGTAITVHGYSLYGRFLFRALNDVVIRHCVFVGCDTGIEVTA